VGGPTANPFALHFVYQRASYEEGGVLPQPELERTFLR
jgi:hypothetical protein